MKTVLFACVRNAGRSQMAATFFNHLADPLVARAVSAGTDPAEKIHGTVAEAMREVGFDLAGVRPRRLTQELEVEVDHLVTMGCGEACLLIPSARREDWSILDPKDQPLAAVRRIREEIRERVLRLVGEHGWSPP